MKTFTTLTTCSALIFTTLSTNALPIDDDNADIKADGGPAQVMRSKGLTLDGILTRNNGEIQSGGGFTLEGELVRNDSSSVNEEKLDAIIAAKRKANAKLTGKDKQSLTLVKFDKDGNALPGGPQLLDFKKDDLPTLISFDLNDDTIDDLVVFHKDKDGFSGLIERDDGKFDLWLDLKPDTNLKELADKKENNDALLFNPTVEDKDTSTDNEEDDNNSNNDMRTLASLVEAAVKILDNTALETKVSTPFLVTINDFDDDGILDLSIEEEDGEISVLFGEK